jgi:hypothetical protein
MGLRDPIEWFSSQFFRLTDMEIENEDRRQCCWDLWIARGWYCFICHRRAVNEDPATFDRGPFGSRRPVILNSRMPNLIQHEPLYCLCGWEFEAYDKIYNCASCSQCHFWGCATVVRVLCDRLGDWGDMHDLIFMYLRVPLKKMPWISKEQEYWYMLQWLDRIYRHFGREDLLTRLRQRRKALSPCWYRSRTEMLFFYNSE